MPTIKRSGTITPYMAAINTPDNEGNDASTIRFTNLVFANKASRMDVIRTLVGGLELFICIKFEIVDYLFDTFFIILIIIEPINLRSDESKPNAYIIAPLRTTDKIHNKRNPANEEGI